MMADSYIPNDNGLGEVRIMPQFSSLPVALL